MYYDYFSNFARRNCAFFSDAVPVHRVVRAVEFKMATGCKFLSLAASLACFCRHFDYTAPARSSNAVIHKKSRVELYVILTSYFLK